jgi:hypothetical protein
MIRFIIVKDNYFFHNYDFAYILKIKSIQSTVALSETMHHLLHQKQITFNLQT